MKTKANIIARDYDKTVIFSLRIDTRTGSYTRGEHSRIRNEITDGVHAALKGKFFAAQIKIRC